MERQRSFSFKSRYLFFSFLVSSSIIFLTFFTFWVFKSAPFTLPDSDFELNRSSIVVDFKTISVQTVETDPVLKDNASISVSIAKERDESEKVVRNFTTVQESVISPVKAEAGRSKTTLVEARNATSVMNVKATLNKGGVKECDVTKGRWVYDERYPLYTNSSCPFIDEGFDCLGNGRLDKDYMKLRWQPQDCDIPRFNATKMLNLIRGKRLVFVGDSINRNQWESMLCLLMGAVKDPKMVYETRGRRITKEKGVYSFRFVEYKCTVEYYVSHFLVHEGKGRVGQKRVQTLRIDAIDRGSSKWRGADILVFNTAHWWSHFKTKSGINYYQEGNQVHPKLDVSLAFRRALSTWASWVDRHINPRKTRVFFRSSAPSHFRGGQWNAGGHCQEARQPLNETSGEVFSEKDTIVGDVIKHMKTPVAILNITSLSQFRIDGHPSIFGQKNSKRRGGQDCSHWCLPGIPDVWNELLYFQLLLTLRGNFR
ncbi:TRICHOME BIREFRINGENCE-LIKE 6 [Euphorbia peplus]|nr:TRICHOME BIREFRINGENCE-LIKE 6 [Euphorbia peplus]